MIYKYKMLAALILMLSSGVAFSSTGNIENNYATNDQQIAETISSDEGNIPYKVTGSGFVKSLLKAVFYIIVLAGIALSITLLYRRRYNIFEKDKQSKRIRLLETKRLSPTTVTFLVSVDNREYFVSQIGTSGSIHQLTDIRDNLEK